MNFEQALARTGRFEAGFQNDPNDSGNWTGAVVGRGSLKGTKFGISAASYPLLDINRLTWGEAGSIYERDFWVKAGCDRIPETLSGEVFDVAVLAGVSRAVKFLQRATKLPIQIDGDFGPRTRLAVLQGDPDVLLRRFDGHFLDFLNDDPVKWSRYGRGWVQRAAERMIAT